MPEFTKSVALSIAIFVAVTFAFAASVLLDPVLKPHPARSGIYAVFLANGQVYFGNITKETDQVVRLENIYYFQSKGLTPEALSVGSDVTLQKLGNEIHGPEDWMEIREPQILFVEKLKNDGKVATAIREYKPK